jgi:hypothetical protein
MRPQAMALSPDGRWLAVSGKTPELLLIPIPLGEKVQRVPFSAARRKTRRSRTRLRSFSTLTGTGS